jgi:ABC-type nitrate/sulfonate/bicarbonate transport system ATPase subunit
MNTYSRTVPLLRIEGVTKNFGDHQVLGGVNTQILDLHCSVAERCVGQVVALLGPSGCGKTVLMKIIAGLDQPSSGAVYLNDDKTPVKAGMVGVVFQDYPMFRNRTVFGNLRLAGHMAGMTDDAARVNAINYLARFELDKDSEKYPAQLSGGMRQRVAICRQLISMDGPKSPPSRLLLMDEPFSALDPKNIRFTCKLLRGVADMSDRNTIVIVTHDMRAALSVADMIWVMGRSPSGSTIVREMDLAQDEFAWTEESYADKRFAVLETELTGMF